MNNTTHKAARTMARRSDHTREEIKEMALAAAKRIVAKQGYGALSTRKVAAGIGYTVGSLYLVFKNLEDLVLHVNGATLDDLYAAMKETEARCKDPEQCILALAHTYVRYAFTNHALWGLIFEHPMPAKRPSWFDEKVERMFALVEEPLRAACADRTAKDLRTAAHALWSGVHGVTVLGLGGRLDNIGVKAAEELAASLVTNYLAGFKSQTTTKKRKN